MEDKHQVRLGAIQETLFVPLAARAVQTQKKHPVLRDPKAAEMVRSIDYDTANPLPVPDAPRRSRPGQDHGHHLVPSQLPGSGRLGFHGAGGRAGLAPPGTATGS